MAGFLCEDVTELNEDEDQDDDENQYENDKIEIDNSIRVEFMTGFLPLLSRASS